MFSTRSTSLAIATLVLALLPGCALMGESPTHVGGRASLDQAAAAANPDSSRKHRRLDVGDTVTPMPQTEVSVSGSSLTESGHEGEVEARGGGSRPPDSHGVLSLIAGAGAIGGSRYDGFGDFGLELGSFVGDRWRFDLLGAVGPIQFADQTIAGQSFKDEFDLSLEISARYYLTPAHTFLGAYPLAGVRFGTLFWDYAKPVSIVEDGVKKTVDSDQINHFSVFAGFGCSLVQTRHFHTGFQLLSGARFYSSDSQAGFSNTLFPAAGYVLGRLEVSYRF